MKETKRKNTSLFAKLKNYSESDYYAFHMPGHKRNLDLMQGTSPYRIDITEIDGFDDLHHAEGILKDAQERAARVYHADETHFLVNGSTVGILSAIMGTTRKGDSILVARNCHKSVYHAIYLNELDPVYLFPKFDTELGLSTEIDVEDVKEALRANPKIRAVMIVSPTYDGVVSDIETIAAVCHEAGCPLIVDEAHGAHFGFHPYFPKSANQYGADLVINSLHKTLPALTQTALLHVNGNLVNRRKVKRYLDMLQTSSPSYILMASIDACIHAVEKTLEKQETAGIEEKILEKQKTSGIEEKCNDREFERQTSGMEDGNSGNELADTLLFETYVNRIDALRNDLKQLQHLKIIQTDNIDHYDRSKFVISVKDAPLSSHELYEILLKKYHLQMEMLAGTYVLAMTTVGDTEEGLKRLKEALFEIDTFISESDRESNKNNASMPDFVGKQPALKKVWTIAEAVNIRDEYEFEDNSEEMSLAKGHKAKVSFRKSIGHISLEYAYLYPPGSPLIVPGERISEEAVEILQWYQEHDFSIEGLQSEDGIEVWIDG
ncbi:aminotransferase class I/II-fold pyridoxal phosphate-dependent enzyme [Dorea sp.]